MPKAPRPDKAARSTQADARPPETEGAASAPSPGSPPLSENATPPDSTASTSPRTRSRKRSKGRAAAKGKGQGGDSDQPGPRQFTIDAETVAALELDLPETRRRPGPAPAEPVGEPDQVQHAPRSAVPTLFPLILFRIAGGETARAILAEPDMPHRGDFYAYLLDPDHPERFDQYARARVAQSHTWADETVEIADDAKGDARFDFERGEFVMDGEFVQRSKIRVSARQWLIARTNRRDYGERLDLTSDNKPMGGVVMMPPEAAP